MLTTIQPQAKTARKHYNPGQQIGNNGFTFVADLPTIKSKRWATIQCKCTNIVDSRLDCILNNSKKSCGQCNKSINQVKPSANPELSPVEKLEANLAKLKVLGHSGKGISPAINLCNDNVDEVGAFFINFDIEFIEDTLAGEFGEIDFAEMIEHSAYLVKCYSTYFPHMPTQIGLLSLCTIPLLTAANFDFSFKAFDADFNKIVANIYGDSATWEANNLTYPATPIKTKDGVTMLVPFFPSGEPWQVIVDCY